MIVKKMKWNEIQKGIPLNFLTNRVDVWEKVKCECTNISEGKITSIKQLEVVEKWLEQCVSDGIFIEEVPAKPCYIGYSGNREGKWYATKWYRCKICGCLWEWNQPDFPAAGFLRRISDEGR